MYHRQEKLKLSKRDLKIRVNITNLGPAVDYFNLENTKKKGIPLHCIRRQPEKDFMILCPGCDKSYHAECLETTEEELTEAGLDSFRCPWCDPYTALVNGKINVEEVGPAPGLEELPSTVESASGK